jgi:hypothetical protein
VNPFFQRLGALLAALASFGLALGVPAASATFHRMSIREVYPGTIAEPDSEYVELQMWNAGQNLVGAHTLRTYDSGGTPTATVLPSDVPNGANQSTILIATPQAEARFGVTADAPLSSSGQLDPTGGAVCWEAIDCVAWGSFGASLPSPVGTPAAAGGIPDEMALRRTIAPGRATLLEPTDDHDNSAADFSVVFPTPRPNSDAPSEHACGSSNGSANGSGSNGRGAPQTTLKQTPPHRTHDRTPTFQFAADEKGATFQCKVDGKPYKTCRSPFTTRRLSLGHHVFKVRARDDSGTTDPSPATFSFKVIRG